MIPRVSAPSINGCETLEDISELLVSNTSPWWVVLGDKVDKIQGVAKREKLLTAIIKKNKFALITELCEPVEYIPEMIKIDKLLTTFDNDNKGVKVVVDEFGGFVGLIGAEAILSVLAGWWKK